jgi:hypothetical protein
MAKAKLESEGIDVFLKDELTTQVNNLYSNAIGGVKLQVKEEQLGDAVQILKEIQIIHESEESVSPIIIYLDTFTRKLPFIGNSILELRILILVVLVLLAIFLPMVIFQ